MNNREKLKHLFLDIFLLNHSEFNFELKREKVETWDSLGIVALAVGIEETFGYHLKPKEAIAIKGIPDIINILETNGISFSE